MTVTNVAVSPDATDRFMTPAPPVLRLWLVELRKLVDTPAGIALVAVGALLAGAFGGGTVLIRDHVTYGDIARMAGVPGGLLVPVLAILLVTAERSQRTAAVTYALVTRRSRVLLAKAAAAATLAVTVSVLALLAALIITPIGAAITGGAADWHMEWWPMLVFTLGSVVAALSGVALGLLIGNAPAAIVIVLIWPMLASGLSQLDRLGPVLEWLDIAALTSWQDGITGREIGQVLTGIAVWVVIPGIIGWLRVVRGAVR